MCGSDHYTVIVASSGLTVDAATMRATLGTIRGLQQLFAPSSPDGVLPLAIIFASAMEGSRYVLSTCPAREGRSINDCRYISTNHVDDAVRQAIPVRSCSDAVEFARGDVHNRLMRALGGALLRCSAVLNRANRERAEEVTSDIAGSSSGEEPSRTQTRAQAMVPRTVLVLMDPSCLRDGGGLCYDTDVAMSNALVALAKMGAVIHFGFPLEAGSSTSPTSESLTSGVDKGRWMGLASATFGEVFAPYTPSLFLRFEISQRNSAKGPAAVGWEQRKERVASHYVVDAVVSDSSRDTPSSSGFALCGACMRLLGNGETVALCKYCHPS